VQIGAAGGDMAVRHRHQVAAVVRVEVEHARSTDEGGRGLFLVAQLAHRWGARYTGDGKIIWAEQEFPQS
ncbi:ATP-binding protein, partial [Streptomyces sp. NPDC005921]